MNWNKNPVIFFLCKGMVFKIIELKFNETELTSIWYESRFSCNDRTSCLNFWIVSSRRFNSLLRRSWWSWLDVCDSTSFFSSSPIWESNKHRVSIARSRWHESNPLFHFQNIFKIVRDCNSYFGELSSVILSKPPLFRLQSISIRLTLTHLLNLNNTKNSLCFVETYFWQIQLIILKVIIIADNI